MSSSQGAGNSAAMREALERARNTLLGVRDLTDDSDIRTGVVNCLVEYIEPALAAPPRNCDVGTVYEQSDRFAKFCKKHADGCGLGYGSRGIGHPKVTCPAFDNGECALVWAQMPYEDGGAK